MLDKTAGGGGGGGGGVPAVEGKDTRTICQQ